MNEQTKRLRESLLGQPVQPFPEQDLGLAIELLGDPEPRVQRLVGEALIRTGPAAIPSVAGSLTSPNRSARRAASFVLGELLRHSSDQAATQALRKALADEDPKVRKNAAVALGKIADAGAVEALAQQLLAEPMNYVRPSIILALGQLGGSAAHTVLAGYTAQTNDDLRALQLALEHSGDTEISAVNSDLPISAPIDLLCRYGAEPLLIQELSQADISYVKKGPGFVRIPWHGSLAGLFRFRCFNTPAFPVLDLPNDPAHSPHSAAKAFASSPALKLIAQLTERKRPEAIRYRVTFEPPPRSGVSGRGWIDDFKSGLEPLAPHLVNSPGRYSWELLVRYEHNQWYLGIRPTAYHDPRFAYRVADVPAALNPAVAAAMARLIPHTDNDIVVDPFCGSGTPLVERARYAPYRLLVGIDRDAQALESAKQNTLAAGVEQIKLLKGDAYQLQSVLTKHSISAVDAIITNPPYGVRIGSPDQIERLYPAFMAQAAAVLRPGGLLVMLAKNGKLAHAAAQQHGFATDRQFRIDTGGILVWLYAFRRA